jgi:hypothetical protein
MIEERRPLSCDIVLPLGRCHAICLGRTFFRYRRQQDGVKGSSGIIEGDGNNLSIVIDRRSGIER